MDGHELLQRADRSVNRERSEVVVVEGALCGLLEGMVDLLLVVIVLRVQVPHLFHDLLNH